MNTILVVDDDSHVRELVSVFLQREGFAVVEAIDGVEALEKLATRTEASSTGVSCTWTAFISAFVMATRLIPP